MTSAVCLLFPLLLTLASCRPGAERQGILIIRGDDQKLALDREGLKAEVTSDLAYLAEDSLRKYRQLMLAGFSADSLTAGHQRNVERFIQMGGQVYVQQLSMSYQRQWPLLENLLDTDREEALKMNVLANAGESINALSLGNGRIYHLPVALDWEAREFTDLLLQNDEEGGQTDEASLPPYPNPERFTYTTLFSGLNEPTEFEVLPNRDILLVERGGAIKYYDQQLDEIKTIGKVPVNYTQSNGLNGLALYPDFRRKPWVFVSYSHATEPFQYISRFYLAGDSLIMNSEKVIAAGWVDDVRPYFSISDCLAFPSYREGFPNVVMQSGAMGLFSIVSDINGCNEIVQEGVNGTIVPPKNTEALYLAMKHVLENKESLSKEKSTFRELIKNKYERSFIWQELLKEYRKLE